MTVKEYNLCVDKWADSIYRFLLKNIGNVHEAKDLVQDTFEKVWIKKEEVQFENAKSYCFTAAYHLMLNRLKIKKRTDFFDSPAIISANCTIQVNDLKEYLDLALTQLPEIQRTVILLRDYEGYNYAEIGDITGLSEAQVKVYIYRARVAMKNILVKMEVELI